MNASIEHVVLISSVTVAVLVAHAVLHGLVHTAFFFDRVIGAIGSLVFLITFSSINLFVSDMLEALLSLPRTAFNRSACWVEMNFDGLLDHCLSSISLFISLLLGAELIVLWIVLGSTDLSADCTSSTPLGSLAQRGHQPAARISSG